LGRRVFRAAFVAGARARSVFAGVPTVEDLRHLEWRTR
jgi:hypothetical protein